MHTTDTLHRGSAAATKTRIMFGLSKVRGLPLVVAGMCAEKLCSCLGGLLTGFLHMQTGGARVSRAENKVN